MVSLARKENLGFVEIRSANPYLDPWIPGEGEDILLPNMHLLPDAPREGIVINLPEMRLYFFRSENAKPISFPIGIGREGLLTPTGSTHVIRKAVGPTWRPTKRMRQEDPSLPQAIPPGPKNPLGSHILYLGWPEYGIHGTNQPFGIGRRVSSGCIRMYPESILELYELVKEGTKVTVVDQPIKASWIENQLFVEAHLTMEQADKMEQDGGLPQYAVSNDEMSIIIKTAGDNIDQIDWRKLRKVLRARSGYPVIVAVREDPDEFVEESVDKEDTQKDADNVTEARPVYN
jgi:L,D-transpeptidase ErfK/SrfK